MTRLSIAAIVAWGLAGIVPFGCAQQEGHSPPGAKADQPKVEQPKGDAVKGEFATAEDLLAALEKADSGMVTLTGELVYDVKFEIQGDRQVRKGKLYFENRDPRKFAVKFEELWIGDTVRKEQQVIVFDGEWLVEKDFVNKSMIKRQVVAPGQKFDPLKIGEGPLPIPIGQKKADVLMRFAATMLPAGDGLAVAADAAIEEKKEAEGLEKHVSGATQVKLQPKPEFARETDFKEVRLWYRRDKLGNLLPVMARTVSKNMNVSVVQLDKVQVQMTGRPKNLAAEVPRDVMSIVSPPDGWDFQVMPYHKHVEADR